MKKQWLVYLEPYGGLPSCFTVTAEILRDDYGVYSFRNGDAVVHSFPNQSVRGVIDVSSGSAYEVTQEPA